MRIIAGADRAGRLLPMLRNMGAYAREFETMDEARVDALLGEAEAAVENGQFLGVLPQFVITATRP